MKIILSNTSFLLGKNIFFVNKNFLLEKFNKLKFFENISIKKKYILQQLIFKQKN